MSGDWKDPVMMAALLREARDGVEQTVRLFKNLGIEKAQIVLLFREAADKLEEEINDSPVIDVPPEKQN